MKGSKENQSVGFFLRTLTHKFGEPTREFLAELLNVFPSKIEQLCKIVTIPQKHFPGVLPPGTLNALLTILTFFAECPNSSSSKTKKNETDCSLQEKDVFPKVVHLDAETEVFTSLLKIFSRNPKCFVQSEKIFSWIKSFAVRTTFLNRSSVNVD